MTVPGRDLLPLLERSTSAFAAVLGVGDLAAPVASCPGYALADLGSHLGGVHLWATAALRASAPPPRPAGGPVERAALVDWYAGTARALLDTIEATDPSAPCFTLGPPHTAAFWLRRQVHETTVHLWDAQSALGRPDPLDAALSADGIAEVLEVFLPRQVALGRTSPVSQPVALLATDTSDAWVVGEGEPVGAVRGPAAVLLLLLWKRTTLDDPALDVDGDPGPTLSAALTP